MVTDDAASPDDLAALARIADRLDALADTAELMGDPDGAARLRAQSAGRRLQAMHLLDG